MPNDAASPKDSQKVGEKEKSNVIKQIGINPRYMRNCGCSLFYYWNHINSTQSIRICPTWWCKCKEFTKNFLNEI